MPGQPCRGCIQPCAEVRPPRCTAFFSSGSAGSRPSAVPEDFARRCPARPSACVSGLYQSRHHSPRCRRCPEGRSLEYAPPGDPGVAIRAVSPFFTGKVPIDGASHWPPGLVVPPGRRLSRQPLAAANSHSASVGRRLQRHCGRLRLVLVRDVGRAVFSFPSRFVLRPSGGASRPRHYVPMVIVGGNGCEGGGVTARLQIPSGAVGKFPAWLSFGDGT